MTLRSLLFVPGDSERKQERARTTAADALILDLEDSVSAERLPAARAIVRDFLRSRDPDSGQQLWVRVNGPESEALQADLEALVGAAPDGLVVPKVSEAGEVVALDRTLTQLEERTGRPALSTRLLVIATETPRGMLSTAGYTSLPRVSGLTWGAEDLAAALGASTNRDPDGSYAFTYRLARSLCLVAAAALGVQAIDTVFTDFRNGDALRHEAAAARREGFTGKLAIHPDQVAIINEAFTPDAAEIEKARRIVEAFEAAKGSGVFSLDGRMIDRPHLLQAHRVLGAAARAARKSSG